MSKSKVLSYISKCLPGIISKESVEELISRNELSWEAANSIVSDLDMAGARSTESSDTKVVHKDIADVKDMGIAEDAFKRHYANVKFEALLNKIQDDDTLMYDEFVNIDNARNKIMSDIIAKHETDLNIMLNQLKTTGGTNASAIDALIQTKLGVASID